MFCPWYSQYPSVEQCLCCLVSFLHLKESIQHSRSYKRDRCVIIVHTAVYYYFVYRNACSNHCHNILRLSLRNVDSDNYLITQFWPLKIEVANERTVPLLILSLFFLTFPKSVWEFYFWIHHLILTSTKFLPYVGRQPPTPFSSYKHLSLYQCCQVLRSESPCQYIKCYQWKGRFLFLIHFLTREWLQLGF